MKCTFSSFLLNEISRKDFAPKFGNNCSSFFHYLLSSSSFFLFDAVSINRYSAPQSFWRVSGSGAAFFFCDMICNTGERVNA